MISKIVSFPSHSKKLEHYIRLISSDMNNNDFSSDLAEIIPFLRKFSSEIYAIGLQTDDQNVIEVHLNLDPNDLTETDMSILYRFSI